MLRAAIHHHQTGGISLLKTNLFSIFGWISFDAWSNTHNKRVGCPNSKNQGKSLATSSCTCPLHVQFRLVTSGMTDQLLELRLTLILLLSWCLTLCISGQACLRTVNMASGPSPAVTTMTRIFLHLGLQQLKPTDRLDPIPAPIRLPLSPSPKWNQ